MDRQGCFHRFNLNNDKPLDEKIYAKSRVHMDALVIHWQGHLGCHGQAAQPQLMGQASFVDRLQQSRTKRGMNRVGGMHDFPRYAIMFRAWLGHPGVLGVLVFQGLITSAASAAF